MFWINVIKKQLQLKQTSEKTFSINLGIISPKPQYAKSQIIKTYIQMKMGVEAAAFRKEEVDER